MLQTRDATATAEVNAIRAATRSWRAAAGRAQLLAKKGVSGCMQRPTELVPIAECGVKASDGSSRDELMCVSSTRYLFFRKSEFASRNFAIFLDRIAVIGCVVE